jgi:phage shock protein C
MLTHMGEIKKLTRPSDRMLGGVCAGLAKYFNVDPTIVRIGTVVLMLITAVVPVTIAYIIGWILIPEENSITQ